VAGAYIGPKAYDAGKWIAEGVFNAWR